MEAMPTLWNNWLLMAWIVPTGLAISAVIDVLLVERRVFANAHEAAAISGLLGVVPLLFAPLLGDTDLFPDLLTVTLAIAAGAIYTWHLLFYFRALFSANDVAHAETFLSLAVLAVPLLSFLMFGEQLTPAHYVGISLAAAGIAVLTFAGRGKLRGSRSVTGLLIAAVICVSVSLLLEDRVFERCDFWAGTFWFAVGSALCSVYFGWRSGLRSALHTISGNRGALFLTNLTAILALAASLRATDLSTSVSLVIAIETVTPVMIMALSTLLLIGAQLSRAPAPGLRLALSEQLTDAPVKIGSMSLILIGVMLVSATH